MHWTYPVPLRLVGWRNVYTIHDAIPLAHPELSQIDPVRHRKLLSRIVDQADGIVTVSNAARGEIANELGIEPAQIVNCSQPVSPASDGGPPPAGLTSRNYLLALGSVEPRKNVQRLLKAYAASQVRMPLVVAGPASQLYPDLEAAIATTPGAIRLPDVAAGDLGRLISGARALVMPSLAEGFGLPVAEAMALGTPVITACRGALAETAGGGALLIEPTDISALACALQQITTDPDLCRRLSEAGLRNTSRFSPAMFAGALASFYGDLLAATSHSR
ncbi:glycosyltransferase family 1 protein [Sphingomonas sp. BIUV-7]|uniref:Glycosyltransferase family 1 protein n=1 Tax=Sphingomonas natans TaxID=3063330 RepID=A0ABT8Y702_9SPHN|nr:glycosyltransferase family 1 protein [Sphingomonas sp. BIUV-7]MDO6413683.1 glycosyltransferase family 1 protein [Sphingomonas sp. BIUV-7]